MSLLGKRLKQLRLQRGLFQKDIATLLSVSTSAYGYYEQEKRTPDIATLHFLSNYYKVSIDYLLGKTDDPTPFDEPKRITAIEEEIDCFIEKIQETDGILLYGEPIDMRTKKVVIRMLKNTKELAQEMKEFKEQEED